MRNEFGILVEKYKENYQKLDSLESRLRMVKDLELASVSDINLSNLRRKWDNFSLKFTSFSQILKDGEKRIFSEIKGDLKKMNPEIDKFYEKIKNVDVSSKKNLTKEEEDNFAFTMKDIKEEWDEI